MISRKTHLILWTALIVVSVLVSGCNLLSSPVDSNTATPTPTTLPGGGVGEPDEPENPCEGFGGHVGTPITGRSFGSGRLNAVHDGGYSLPGHR